MVHSVQPPKIEQQQPCYSALQIHLATFVTLAYLASLLQSTAQSCLMLNPSKTLLPTEEKGKR